MIAPTSVSSKFKARPVTPLPKSSISLSIASVRPSIFATPSPISRTIPTFCFAAVVLTPAICVSISCNKVLIFLRYVRESKAFLKRGQAGLDAAIIDVAADFYPHPTDESAILAKRKIQAGAVYTSQQCLDIGLELGRQRYGAFNPSSPTFQLEFHQPSEV